MAAICSQIHYIRTLNMKYCMLVLEFTVILKTTKKFHSHKPRIWIFY